MFVYAYRNSTSEEEYTANLTRSFSLTKERWKRIPSRTVQKMELLLKSLSGNCFQFVAKATVVIIHGKHLVLEVPLKSIFNIETGTLSLSRLFLRGDLNDIWGKSFGAQDVNKYCSRRIENRGLYNFLHQQTDQKYMIFNQQRSSIPEKRRTAHRCSYPRSFFRNVIQI